MNKREARHIARVQCFFAIEQYVDGGDILDIELGRYDEKDQERIVGQMEDIANSLTKIRKRRKYDGNITD